MKSVRRIIDRYYLRQIAACFLVSCLFFNTSVLLALEPGNLTGSTGLTGASWGANTVLDTENGAVLNWNNFDTLNGQSVTFNQYLSGVLNSSSAVLNRISSGNVPTQFNGALSANGRVFIVNPAGVVFGAGASVNVAQLVASGLNMSDSDFANYISTGNMKFTNHALAGQVANNGTINASQAVYLIGKNVLNSSTGAINCPGGVIVMAAGDTVQIAQPGNAVTVTAANPDLREIDNSGELNTSGGKIILAAGDIYSKALGNVDGLSATAEVADVKMSALKDIEVDGDITATGNIAIASNTDGIGSGDVEAQKLTAGQTVDIKATNSVINLHDDIKATLQDIILRSSTIADDGVKLDAGRDVVLNDGLFVGTGDLTIEADRNINIGGNIAVNGDLILTPDTDNTNGGVTNFTALANQDVVSYHGSVISNGAIDKSTQIGNLGIYAMQDIILRGSTIANNGVILDAGRDVMTNDGLLVSGGDLTIEANRNINLGVNIAANGDLIVTPDADNTNGGVTNFTALANQDVVSYHGSVISNGAIDKSTQIGNLGIYAMQDIILRGDTESDNGLKLDSARDVVVANGKMLTGKSNLTVDADRLIYLGGDAESDGDIFLNGNTKFTSLSDQHVLTEGSITANGFLDKSKGGSLYLDASGDIALKRYVNVSWGGISIISKDGKIYTPGFVDILNIPITGFSDQFAGKGVRLPYGEGLAAIVIKSAADLLIGPSAVLMACGNYQPYGGPVDDRSSVGFITEPEYIPAAGSDLRDPGESFDAAIYLASTTGDVDVSSLVTIVPGLETPSMAGAMVIDAYRNVTFDNFDGVPGGGWFENSLKGGFLGDTLEVCSRITEWLQQAAGRLPYPYGGAPVPENYHYVLRGAGLDNPAITDGRAWVLEDKHVPPPSVPRMDLPEIEGCPAVMDAAAQELGIIGGNIQLIIARTLADGRSIQPCDSCGRLLRSAEVLSDDGGKYLAALVEVINTIAPPEKPFSPELAAQIAFTIQSLKGGSGVYESAQVYIDAFAEYASILKREINAPIDDPLIYVLEKYGQGLLANPNTNAASYVAAQIEGAIK